MRLLVLFALCCAGVSSFDLGAIRGSAVVPPAPPRSPPDGVHQKFSEPLGFPNFLPLCGNGILNSKADYAAMYDAGHALLDVSARVPGLSVKLMVDEVCDDGNRLDGDGCSADCMNFDLFQPVCRVASDELIEAMAMDEGSVYVSTRDLVGRVGVGLQGIFTDWNVSKTFVVDSMAVDGGRIFLYSASVASMYKVDKLGSGPVEFVKTFDIVGGERGDFLRDGGLLLLFIKDAHRIRLVNAANLNDILAFNTSESLSPTVTVSISNGRIEANLLEKIFSVNVDGSDVALVSATSGIGGMSSLWYDLSLPFFRSRTILDIVPSAAEVVSPGEDPQETQMKLELDPVGIRFANPLLYATKDPSLRDILLPKMAGQHGPVFATGRLELLKAAMSNSFDCNGAETCVLDIPVEYDLLRPSTYGLIGRTYYDEIKDALSMYAGEMSTMLEREPWVLRFLNMVNEKTYIPRTMFTLPGTLDTWFLRSGGVYVLTKRGVVIEDSVGYCIPVDVMPCPSCQWATIGHTCQPCAVPSESMAWSVQCHGCAANASKPLPGYDIVVSVAVANASRAELVGAFSETATIMEDVFASIHERGSAVNIVSTDPAATLRNVSLALSRNPHWKVLIPPKSLYSSDDYVGGQGKSDDTREFMTFLVVAAAVILIVMCLVIGCCCWLLNRRTYTKLPSEKTPGGLFDVTIVKDAP